MRNGTRNIAYMDCNREFSVLEKVPRRKMLCAQKKRKIKMTKCKGRKMYIKPGKMCARENKKARNRRSRARTTKTQNCFITGIVRSKCVLHTVFYLKDGSLLRDRQRQLSIFIMKIKTRSIFFSVWRIIRETNMLMRLCCSGLHVWVHACICACVFACVCVRSYTPMQLCKCSEVCLIASVRKHVCSCAYVHLWPASL